MQIIHLISVAIVTGLVTVAAIFGLHKEAPQLGATMQTIAGTTYSLAGSGISSSATSFTATTLTLPQNGYKIQDSDLSSTFYITFEPGNRTRQEIVSCTTVGTNTGGTVTISGCTRGLSPISPYTASTTLQFSHAGGTSFIFSNPPQLYEQLVAKDNNAAITGTYTYTSTAQPRYDAAPSFGGCALCLVDYTTLTNTAISGAGTSTEIAMGIGRIATDRQAASSTASSTTGAPLFLSSRYATDTPQRCTTYSCIVMTQIGGKIRQTFLDLSEAFTWTGAHIFQSSVTVQGATTLASTTATTANINSLNVAGSAVNATSTGWNLLVSTTTTAAMSIATVTPATATHYRVEFFHNGISTANVAEVFFNGDVGATNYGWAIDDNNNAEAQNSGAAIQLTNLSTTSPAFYSIDIYNTATKRKYVTWTGGFGNSAAIPTRTDGFGIWNNTSSQISSMEFLAPGGRTFAIGTQIIVYGSNF